MGQDNPECEFSILQKLVLHEETQDAIKLIEYGLGCSQKIDGANDFYHPPILLLGSGFERLLKIILILEWLESEGAPPQENDLYKRKNGGHSVCRLLETVIKRCYSTEPAGLTPALQSDREFLLGNSTLKEIVRILTDFGRGGRYYNLDVLFEPNKIQSSPKADWEQLETVILLATGISTEQLIERPFTDIYEGINRSLVEPIERFARALTRLFTLGPLGKLGRAQHPAVSPFLSLRDEDFGKRRY